MTSTGDHVRQIISDKFFDVESKIHLCPIDGSGLMRCCGRTPFEVKLTDRITNDENIVTCKVKEE